MEWRALEYEDQFEDDGEEDHERQKSPDQVASGSSHREHPLVEQQYGNFATAEIRNVEQFECVQ